MTSLRALLPLHHFAALLHYITVALHDVLCGCGGSCFPSLRWRPCKPQSRRRAQVPRPQFGTVDRSVVFNVCAPTQFAPLHHGAIISLHALLPLHHFTALLHYVTIALHDVLYATVLPHCSPARHHCSTTLHYASAPSYALRPLYHSTAMHHCTTATSSLHYTASSLPHATAPLHALLRLHCITPPCHDLTPHRTAPLPHYRAAPPATLHVS